MNILDDIISSKKREVELARARVPAKMLEGEKYFSYKPLSLKRLLQLPASIGIIGEFKKASPSKGVINEKVIIEDVVRAYAAWGASGISVLTDNPFFSGHLDDLKRARIEVEAVPILRKDFIIDEYQVLETKAFGADVILLIAACLHPKQVKKLADFAKRLGLEVFLEVHNEMELGHICEGIDLVGVNNRDLKNFTTDINRSIELSAMIPAGLTKISESGINSTEIVKTLRTLGYDGFLMGENFMKETNPGVAFGEFVTVLRHAMKPSEDRIIHGKK